MKVHVRLFAAAKDLAGSDEVTVQVTDSATVADVREALIAAVPALAIIVPHALWTVDAQYAPEKAPVTQQSEIALIPPVSGG